MSLLRCYMNNPKKWRGNYGMNSFVKVTLVVVVVLLGTLVDNVQGSLSLSKQCGEDVICEALQYCRQHDHQCQPCEDVCNENGNNFSEERCVADCQDYIHNQHYLSLQNSTLLYLQRTELEEKYKDLQDDVFILKLAVGVCVAVIIVVVACLLAFFVYFWKLMHPSQPGTPEEKKKPVNKSASVELPTVYNNRYGVTTPTPETSPSSVISSSPADTNITTLSSSTTIPPSYNGHAHSQTRTPSSVAARASPTKSECSVATPGTATTILMSSAASTLVNGGGRTGNGAVSSTIKFRREPSESTLPENCAYDNLSMSPQHCHYSHHV